MTEREHIYEPMRKAADPAVIDIMRIENAVGTGMSDVNMHCNGVDAWIENKVFHGNQLTFQPTQPGWILNRRRVGGRVFVLARKTSTLYLYDGARVRELISEGIKTPALFTTKKPFDWQEVFSQIFGHRPFKYVK